MIDNRSVKLAKADAKHATLPIRNDWIAEGEVLIEESTTIDRRQRGRGRLRDRPRFSADCPRPT